MADPPKYGSSGPRTGGLEEHQQVANQMNKVNQARQQQIHEARQKLTAELAPKANQPAPDPTREQQKQRDH
jgi:hypothetical protein